MIFEKGIFIEHNNVRHSKQANIGCSLCFTGIASERNHAGSPFCEEGSIASGGKYAHCQCDTCKSLDI
jgi:hypothetical protein